MGRRHFRADGRGRADRGPGRPLLRERVADRRDDAQRHHDEQRARQRGSVANTDSVAVGVALDVGLTVGVAVRFAVRLAGH